MKTYKLKTSVDEVIDYNDIVVESSEEVTTPEKTSTVKVEHTLGSVKQKLINNNEQLDFFTAEKVRLTELMNLIKKEADKVLSAIK